VHHARRRWHDRAKRAEETPDENAGSAVALEKIDASFETLGVPAKWPQGLKQSSESLSEPE